ncbi:MAG: glucosamine-6-phosphate deaminase, partial [Clostridiales bacterium]|nr:glucosamine-6-phosphate deaminase [Clostridiales bacterium]
MEIIIKETYAEMSKYAADLIAETIRNKPDCVLGL